MADRRHSGWWQAKRKAAARLLPCICELCGRWVRATDDWHLDHVRPVAQGGMFGPTRVVHAECNMHAGRQLIGRYRAWTEPPSRRW